METHLDTPPTDQDVEIGLLSGAEDHDLIEQPETEPLPVPAPSDPIRSVNFILDPSAFTLGLGNIERWFDQNYFQSQLKNKSENIHLNLYLPTYTLHELDYQRRGPIVGSSKALEALKFMDRMLENEDDGILNEFDDFSESPVSQPTKKSEVGRFLYSLFIEHRTQQFPNWIACEKYQIRSPSSKELRHHGKYSLYDEINHIGGGSFEDVSDDDLVLPARLKHLIRSGIYLTRMKHNGPQHITGDMWKLVTEDLSTKVWASCFGIDCMNINEAELLLFHDKDLTKFEIKSQGADFFSAQDVYLPEAPGSLHKKVNTTCYKYTDVKRIEEKKRRANDKRPATWDPPNVSTQAESDGHGVRVEEGVLTEEFSMINFAPREEKTKLVVSKLFGKENNPLRNNNKKPRQKKSKDSQKEAKAYAKERSPEKTDTAKEDKASDKKKLRKYKSTGKNKSAESAAVTNLNNAADEKKSIGPEEPIEKKGVAQKPASAKKTRTKKRKSPAKKKLLEKKGVGETIQPPSLESAT